MQLQRKPPKAGRNEAKSALLIELQRILNFLVDRGDVCTHIPPCASFSEFRKT